MLSYGQTIKFHLKIQRSCRDRNQTVCALRISLHGNTVAWNCQGTLMSDFDSINLLNEICAFARKLLTQKTSNRLGTTLPYWYNTLPFFKMLTRIINFCCLINCSCYDIDKIIFESTVTLAAGYENGNSTISRFDINVTWSC